MDSHDPAFRHDVHVFDSGVRVYQSHISPIQSVRYRRTNLHEPIEEAWFHRLTQGSGAFRFADVGAGIGYYSILLKRLRPSADVFCFEPLRLHAEYLAMNLRLNRECVDDLRDGGFSILFEDAAPAQQPDGLVVAVLPAS